jgi:hypothetical protein
MPIYARIVPGNVIHAQDLNQVIDSLDGAAGAGVAIALTQLNDATNYALTVQNDDATNSRALNVLKNDGTTLIKADATGVTLGAPVTLPSQSITNAELGPDVARANLFTNGGFEIWQRGNGPFTVSATYGPDRWVLYIPGGTISVSRDVANSDIGGAAAAVTTTAPAGFGNGIYQIFNSNVEMQQLRNRTVSVSVRVKCSQANSVRVGLAADIGTAPTVFSNYHSGGGTYETLTATIALGVVNGMTVWVTGLVAGTWYVDNACLVVGSQPATYVPLHPADDLARCLRYCEIAGGAGGGDMLGVTHAVSATSIYGAYRWRAQKAVTPTVTFAAPANYTVWTASGAVQAATTIASNGSTIYGMQLNATVASGLAAGNASLVYDNGSGKITIEANP